MEQDRAAALWPFKLWKQVMFCKSYELNVFLVLTFFEVLMSGNKKLCN